MKISNETYVNAARRMYHDEGKIEVDEGARISANTATKKDPELGGVYVQAWVWVANSDVSKDDKP